MKKKSEKRSRIRSLLLFFGILLGSMIVGGVAGGWMQLHQDRVRYFFEAIFHGIQKSSGWMGVFVTVAGMIVTTIFYIRCKKELQRWDGEEEEYMERLDKKCGVGQSLLSIFLILTFSFDAMAFSTFSEIEKVSKSLIIPVIDLVVVLIFYIIIQQKYVELVKKMNPEKQGNTFELNFKKTWLSSCDEQEKMIIYKSSYRSFQALQMAFPLCWMVLLMIGLTMNIGIVPHLMLGTLWLIHTLTYYIESFHMYK